MVKSCIIKSGPYVKFYRFSQYSKFNSQNLINPLRFGINFVFCLVCQYKERSFKYVYYKWIKFFNVFVS